MTPTEGTAKAIRIHKYGNRRLYRTDQSRYVTLSEIADLIRKGADFVVSDAKSGKDLTGTVLAQVILDEEKREVGGRLPLSLLKQLIALRDERLSGFVAHHLPRLAALYLERAEGLEASLDAALTSEHQEAEDLRAELVDISTRLDRLAQSLP